MSYTSPVKTVMIGTNSFSGTDAPLVLAHAPVFRFAVESDQPGALGNPLVSMCVKAPPAAVYLDVQENRVATHAGDSVPTVVTRAHGVTVSLDGHVLLDAELRAANVVEVVSLDLRPLGLAVTADRQALRLGGSHFSGNVFVNGAGIDLGGA